MGAFEIQGGFRLKGEITPQGAKNEALQVISATLLTSEKVVIRNIPDIRDVKNLIELLNLIGVHISKFNEHDFCFQADHINLDVLRSQAFIKLASSIRGSVMILGPLLARKGKGFLPKPGGDKIGRRRLDTHFNGLVKLGAKFIYLGMQDGLPLEPMKIVRDWELIRNHM